MTAAAAQKSKIIIPPTPGEEFAQATLAKIGDLSTFDIFPTYILVAHFIRTRMGTLLAAPQTQREDRWQGKVGLVLKLGTAAFKEAPDAAFHGFKANVGDYIVYRNTDGWDLDYQAVGSFDKVQLRMLQDGEIKGVISRPELIW